MQKQDLQPTEQGTHTVKSMKLRHALALTTLLAFGASAAAGEVEQTTDGGTAWNAGLDGVVIEFDESGAFTRIYSKYTQPVSIPNTRGVRNAKTIAEEKAKAAIIRFLDQEVTRSTFVAEVSADVERSSATSGSDGNVNLSSEASNTMLTSLSEFTSTVSRGNLRGVIRLEEGYDASTGEAWVKVGFSNKTMRTAGAVREAIANDGRQGEASGSAESGQTRSNDPRSHVRKTEQQDW